MLLDNAHSNEMQTETGIMLIVRLLNKNCSMRILSKLENYANLGQTKMLTKLIAINESILVDQSVLLIQ